MCSGVSTLAEEVGDEDVEDDVEDTCSHVSSGGSGHEGLDLPADDSDGDGAAVQGGRLPPKLSHSRSRRLVFVLLYSDRQQVL